MTPIEKLQKCYESFRSKVDFTPEIALILGSGLGALADEIDISATLNYDEIDGFPQSTVPGHKGRFVFGYMDGVPVVIMQGRVHYYEGYGFKCSVFNKCKRLSQSVIFSRRLHVDNRSDC